MKKVIIGYNSSCGEESNVVIIGDNIIVKDKTQIIPNCICILMDDFSVFIGETLFGSKVNIKEQIIDFINDTEMVKEQVD